MDISVDVVAAMVAPASEFLRPRELDGSYPFRDHRTQAELAPVAAKPVRICKSCPATISRQSKSGWCRRCAAAHLNSDPAICARREVRRREFFDAPGVREQIGARVAERNRNMPASQREKLRAHGHRIYATVLSKPEHQAKSQAPEAKRRAAAAQSDTKLAWCPRELRPEYRRLQVEKGLRAAEARAVIEQMIPGTVAHAHVVIANNQLNQHVRAMRQMMEAY